MSEWRSLHLHEVVELRRGFDLPHRERRPGRYPVLSAGLTAGWHDQGPVKGPGFVVGRATNLGKPTWSDGDYWPLNTTLYASNFLGNDPRYLYHLFETLDLSGYDSGSVQPMLNRNYIARVTVRVAPIGEQRIIAEILGALDDKLAANRQLIAVADALASTIFNSMPLDEISVPLTRIARFVNGKAFTKDASGTGRVIIRIAELNSGISGSTVYNDLDVPDVHLARPGDLLFAWSGSLTLRRWFRLEGIINQHIFKVIPVNDYPLWCVYGLLARKLEVFKAIAADKATTMGHIQRRHLEEPVRVPMRSTIEQHDEAMTGLWQRALQAEQESMQLTALRSTLLHELMSGRLRVKDAEKSLEEVL